MYDLNKKLINIINNINNTYIQLILNNRDININLNKFNIIDTLILFK